MGVARGAVVNRLLGADASVVVASFCEVLTVDVCGRGMAFARLRNTGLLDILSTRASDAQKDPKTKVC